MVLMHRRIQNNARNGHMTAESVRTLPYRGPRRWDCGPYVAWFREWLENRMLYIRCMFNYVFNNTEQSHSIPVSVSRCQDSQSSQWMTSKIFSNDSMFDCSSSLVNDAASGFE